MPNRLIGTLVIVAGAVVLASLLAVSSRAQPQTPPPGPERGRAADVTRRSAGPPQPTLRLADGTPNLGRVPGEKGIWNIRIVLDFGNQVVGHEVRGAMNRGPGTVIGGAHLQPWVPFMPWSAAIYNYNLKNEAKYDPEGY